VTLAATRDNTLIESATGALSNGSGPGFFAGRTSQGSQSIRRGVVRFDLAGAVPKGARVASARLDLHVSQTHPEPAVVRVHRALGDWGEAGSRAEGGQGAPAEQGDATWLHAFSPAVFWSRPGGDFAETPSSFAEVVGEGWYSWPSTPALLADVRSWLEDPAQNFGWILLGDEDTSSTVKRFDSRESEDLALRPTLTLEYERGLAAGCDAFDLDEPILALCTAWCDALDCDAEVPVGSAAACGRIERAYRARTGGSAPPCAVADADGDGVEDALDSCPAVFDPDQADGDGDGVGDACDNCAAEPNSDQADTFGALGVGDACDCPCFTATELGALVLELQDPATYTGVVCIDTRIGTKPLTAVRAVRADGAPCGTASFDCGALAVEFTEDNACQLNPPAPLPAVLVQGIGDAQREACRRSIVEVAGALGLGCN